MLPPAVMWVDPGGKTGLAMLRTHPGEFWCDEFAFADACRVLDQQAMVWGHGMVLGWERFDINADTHKKTPAGIHDALHIIGVCRFLAVKYGCRTVPAAQQHTPDAADRDSLRKLGWWLPGKDDAQSAACHLLRWLVRVNELSPEYREMLYS